jgi:cilia- and flagella-associated protein 300
VINMGFFDILQEREIATETGYIRKEPDEFVEEMQLGDRLRYSLAFEESEYYETFDEKMRNEFIFQIFKGITLGGALCQYEDSVKPYLDLTLKVYKDMVAVAKDGETGDIKVISHVHKVTKVGGVSLFFNEGH